LIIEKDAKNSHATANAKSNHKTHQEVNQDIGLIGFTRLAVIFRFAILAFDLREQSGTKRAAPPGEADFLGVALSTLWTGSILSWVLHTSSKINKIAREIISRYYFTATAL
jgi:hypothetical protein